MMAKGHVRNGAIVMPDGLRLVEGQEVIVDVVDATPVERPSHGILDIPTFTLGAALHPNGCDDDLLDEMLESRS
jgi:hypothetical protein